jgi:hypothetical protein
VTKMVEFKRSQKRPKGTKFKQAEADIDPAEVRGLIDAEAHVRLTSN